MKRRQQSSAGELVSKLAGYKGGKERERKRGRCGGAEREKQGEKLPQAMGLTKR